MGHEGPRGRSACQGLQHRRLDLDEPPPLQAVAQRANDRDALPGDGAGLRSDDEVDIALPDPGLLTHLPVCDRKRPQRLGGHLPGVREHRELTGPRADDLSVDEHDVPEVDVGLPGIQRLLTDPGQADHRLQLGAVTLLQGGEAELAGGARQHHAAGHAHDLAGARAGRQIRVGRPDLRQRVSARHRDRVGLAPGVEEPLTLGLPDPELLGRVVPIGLRVTSIVHDEPA